MGNCSYIKSKKEQNENPKIKEEWRYDGNFFEKRLNSFTKQYQLINTDSLQGKIYILDGVNNREIKIKLKGKKYEFMGDEIEKPNNLKNEEKLVFKMRSENGFYFNNVEIIIKSNGITQLKGNDIYIKNNYGYEGPFFLELNLTNHKEYGNFYNYGKINPSNIELSKLINQNDEEDILINSLSGMENLINTCYINSSFQILIHIPQFIKIIRKNKEFQCTIIKEINDIFDQILEQFKKYKKIINPKSFVKYFKSNHYAFNNYSQMDSEMFLEELLWDINIELGNLGEKRIKDLIPNHKKSLKEIDFLNYIIESENETNYEINDLFYVYFIHEKKCKLCHHKTHYFDESPGLKLNFEQTKYKSKIDLISLIMDNFKQPIEIKSLIVCENCRSCFNIIETTRIAKLPKILILTLQKSNTENTQKIPWIVNFDKNIGIREIVDIELIKNESAKYEIFAINNHLGSTPKSGHYYSQIYLEKLGAWYSFNDECVSPESYWKNPNLNNYILFYKQVIK